MLRVTVEYWPFGNAAKRKVLGVFDVINDGTHEDSPEFGNYTVWPEDGEKIGRVINHRRDKGYPALLWMVFKLIARKQKPDDDVAWLMKAMGMK